MVGQSRGGGGQSKSHRSSKVGAAHNLFPHWSQKKTITHHCLSLFLIVSRLGYQTNWLLGLGELLHDTYRRERIWVINALDWCPEFKSFSHHKLDLFLSICEFNFSAKLVKGWVVCLMQFEAFKWHSMA